MQSCIGRNIYTCGVISRSSMYIYCIIQSEDCSDDISESSGTGVRKELPV